MLPLAHQRTVEHRPEAGIQLAEVMLFGEVVNHLRTPLTTTEGSGALVQEDEGLVEQNRETDCDHRPHGRHPEPVVQLNPLGASRYADKERSSPGADWIIFSFAHPL